MTAPSKRLRLALIYRVGAGQKTGFKRKAFQQPFAKSMYGLDLKPAGRFQRTGKQAAGPAQFGLVAGLVSAFKRI